MLLVQPLAVTSRMQGGLAHTRFDTSPVVEGGARGGCGGGGGGGGEGGSGGGWLRSGSMAGGGGGGGERRSSLRGNGSFAPKVCPGLRAYGSEDGGGCQPRKPQRRHSGTLTARKNRFLCSGTIVPRQSSLEGICSPHVGQNTYDILLGEFDARRGHG
ncbi:hypothetical protein FB451DRAFT_1253355 [Mycena latifolia]|nr:hypothetical protein FB451DRAFT_1253355 [Mycena latifolia]